MTKLDDKTTVPLGWVLGGAVTIGGSVLVGVVVGCMWVFTVNARLTRIEQHLGIEQPVATSGIENQADAAVREIPHGVREGR